MLSVLTDYIFIDENSVDGYIEQIPVEPIKERKQSKKVSLSLTGPAVEMGEETSIRPFTTHEKIQRLIAFLRKANLLAERRPKEMPKHQTPDHRPFVLETMTAQKIIIPRRHLGNIDGLRGLAIWISEPSEEDFTDEPWKWHGTFLYLTEAHWDNKPYQEVWSGCSALQAIVNVVNGVQLVLPEPIGNEPFGRWCSDHPIVKLQALGGTVTSSRTITSLYRKRYITDEQCYTINGQERRVNDLLAYPLFISSAL